MIAICDDEMGYMNTPSPELYHAAELDCEDVDDPDHPDYDASDCASSSHDEDSSPPREPSPPPRQPTPPPTPPPTQKRGKHVVYKKPAAQQTMKAKRWRKLNRAASSKDDNVLGGTMPDTPATPLAAPATPDLLLYRRSFQKDFEEEPTTLPMVPRVPLVDAEEGHGVVQKLGMLPSAELSCSKCGGQIDVLRSTGKAGGKWKCRKCNTKMTQLNRLFGCWPIPEFGGISKEQEMAFFNSAHGCDNPSQLDELVIETMTELVKHKESVSLDGEWLPLSCWEKRGYSTSAIVATADSRNSKVNERFGMMYKVTVERDCLAIEREKIREQVRQTRSDRNANRRGEGRSLKRQALPAPPDEDEPEEKADEKKSNKKSKKHKKKRKHSSSSSSDEDSSSSKRKKAKKNKRANHEKEKKEKEKSKDEVMKKDAAKSSELLRKEALKVSAEERKVSAKAARDANRVVAKLSSLEITLDNAAKPQAIHKHVPAFAVKGVQDSLASVQKYLKEAREVLKGKKKTLLSYEMSDVDAIDKEAKQNLHLVTSMVESAQKHARR
jgi:ribosomal protein L37AE/L43A